MSRIRPDTSGWLGTGFGQDAVIDNAFGKGIGRMYERWIDSVNGSTRNEGHAVNDKILIPSSIVESLLRDERFVERDLIITSTVSTTVFTCTDVRFGVDDYYNYSIYVNVTTGFKSYVTDYTGSTNTFTIAAADASITFGNKFYLTNIKGDDKINFASFDVVGNTTNGLRKDWIMGRSIYQETDMSSLLDSLLYESRCILLTSYNQYKIKSISDVIGSVDTWTTPLYSAGNPLIGFGLTPITMLYNDYKINYHYDYGSGEYKKSFFVNKSGYTSTLTNGAAYKVICKSIYDVKGIINEYEYNCNWIYDDDTAELFLDSIFTRYSKQRLTGFWDTPLNDYLVYEVGDQVKLNNSNLIPTGLNNSANFIIEENPITIVPGSPVITFKLLEVS